MTDTTHTADAEDPAEGEIEMAQQMAQDLLDFAHGSDDEQPAG